MLSPPLIQLQNISRSYQEGDQVQHVLDGINLEIQRGECLALLGRSGSGKSTLLNLLGGIDLPDSGQIIIDNQPLNRLTEKARTLFRREHIGIIYQFFNLIPTLTIAENIGLPLELNGETKNVIKNQVEKILSDVGLAKRALAFPDQLSGGEQQRVAIARALVHNPLLILADEPTGNLDAETGRHILSLLTNLSQERNRTLILVTHSREVANTADRTICLDAGKITEAKAEMAW